MTQKKPFAPTLAFVFGAVKLGLPDIARRLGTLNIPVFGSSSGGEIIARPGNSPVSEQSAVCCLLDIPPAYFSVELFDRNNGDAAEFGKQIGKWGAERFSHPAFILLIANLDNNGEEIIRGIESVCPTDTPIFGGFAGDTSIPKKPVVFTNDRHVTDGLVALVVDHDKVSVRGVTTSGWTGIGVDLVITSSKERTVYTINDRPALDVIEEYLNVTDADILPVAINFPLLVKRPDGIQILRTIFAADFPARSIRFAGNVPQGSKVMFSSSFGRNTTVTALHDMETYHTHHKKADLLLMFSCLARLKSSGPRVNDEITAAYNFWKCPLVGLFCCGEIGPAGTGTCELYNESISLVLFQIK
ncbi:FIST signal transduction protein [Methanoregula sp. UBA64]|uniref:FIST signal transduction protein n=1 Tax=Methanoregula sp. UBA64 TaxID=1915554 RepID=UPI0025EBB65C|nr:FIST N-terminal domain-containing protein [Methanoregula sp. UBA64]